MSVGSATHGDNKLSVFLLGAILNILAAVDFTSLIDYSLKALVGGVIWLGFKIAGDIIVERLKKKSEKDKR